MNPDARRKLVGILGLLSSEHDGERAAAGLLATRLLRSAGVTWAEVIPDKAADQPGPTASPADWRTDLVLCQRHVRFLRAWEQGFVGNLAAIRAPSGKQQTILREIANALRARGRA